MSKIDKLIKKLCPDGVESVALGEVLDFDKRFSGVGKGIQRKVLNFKHCSAAKLKELIVNKGDKTNVKLLSTGNFEGWTSEENAGNLVNDGEVVTIPSGGSANLKYHSGKFVDSGNNLASSANLNIPLKYIYYYMLSQNKKIASYFRGSGVAHPSMPDILKMKILIPVKPLENGDSDE